MMDAQPQGMTLRYPATRWQDALPVGSGTVGAMVYGNIQNDTVLLNHDALYYPKGALEVVDVSDLLPETRRLIREGRCREAAQLMPDAYAERTGTEVGSTSQGRDVYQPLCALRLAMATDGPFRNYRRGLDFQRACAWVSWKDDSAATTRELFVSRATDTVFLRIRSDKPGSVACRVSFQRAANEQAGKALTHTGGLPGDVELASSQQACGDSRTVLFRGRYPDGFSFGALGQIEIKGGCLKAVDEALVVDKADELVLRVRLFLGEAPEAAAARLLAEFADRPASFEEAFAEHAALHGELFNRVSLSLAENGADRNAASAPLFTSHSSLAERGSNEELLMAAYDGEVPVALVQRMFEFGRYLLIASSRPGGWPANLQGIWNGDYAPAWNSDIHTDENIQMNYWQAMPGGLEEVALPLFDYFERHLDDFRENARLTFGCRGILLPIAMTTHGREAPCTWSNWTAGAGWIAQHVYDYYLFTGDLEFLEKRAVPWLKEVALFYEDFLTEDEDGRLQFNPSLSPENRPAGSNSLLCINATMDVAVCRELLNNLCDGCERLGIEAEGVARWRGMLEKLPDYGINDDGAMKEWLHAHFKDRYHHRHQSHIYPVFPGLEVTEESDPDVYEACRVAVEKRLVVGLTSQTGWSMAHMANIYARLGQGDRALECLEILSRSSLGPNLFTYHNDWRQMGLSLGAGGTPPFQIDANLGIAAAILEMLVFSKPGLIKLLPALPGKWSTGRVSGIRCRGGVVADMEWNVDDGSFRATLVSAGDQRLRLRLPGFLGQETELQPASAVLQHRGRGDVDIALSKGTPLSLEAGRKRNPKGYRS